MKIAFSCQNIIFTNKPYKLVNLTSSMKNANYTKTKLSKCVLLNLSSKEILNFVINLFGALVQQDF